MVFLSVLPNYTILPQLAEAARNFTFLAFMYGIMQSGGQSAQGGTHRALKAVYASVAAVVGLLLALLLAPVLAVLLLVALLVLGVVLALRKLTG